MSNILISTPPTSLATGLLQLQNGVAISSTPTYVTDQNNTASVLSLATGNVGINTTSTFARLTIANTNTSTSEYLLSASTSTANFYVRNDGYLYNAERARISNILIAQNGSNSLASTQSGSLGGCIWLGTNGTAITTTASLTPTAMLHVKGSGSTSATTSLLVQNSAGTNAFYVRDDRYAWFSKDVTVGGSSSASITMGTGASNNPYINAYGNGLEITTSGSYGANSNIMIQPTTNWQITNTTTGTGFQTWSTGGSERMRILSTGNVGIGTTSPSKLLDVNGDVLINTLTIGRGNNNISSNTAVGYQSLNAITSGAQNIAIGYQSLLASQTGNYNTAIGYRSMYVSTSGTNNTSFGALTSALNSTGSNNVAVGYGAHYSNTTGSNNTLIGYNVQATNFDSSVVIGRDASATASNQFVVGSASYNAGTVTTEVNTSTKVWNVKINGTDYKILLA